MFSMARLSGLMCWLRSLSAGRRAGIVVLVALHIAALATIYSSEYGPFATSLAILSWALLNALGLVVFRRPLISAALSLSVLAALIVLSQFKFNITQLTLTFLDFLIVDQDTVSFLLSIFPQLRWPLAIAALVALPAVWILWRLDVAVVKRRWALASSLVLLGAIVGVARLYPEQPWEPFQGVNHVSNFTRSGVTQVSYLLAHSWIETDRDNGLLTRASAALGGDLSGAAACVPARKPPHIIMVLDESSFDITAAPGIKVPDGYEDYFKSSDGVQRTFVAEATGGPTWYTEFNVLTGLSVRSFGDLKYYVTRIAAGRVQRGLPQALSRCGYNTVSLYPTYGNFLGARNFQKSAGVKHFVDMAEMGIAEEAQPDKFFFDQARDTFAREKAKGNPLFMFVYLTANHFPWTNSYRPDLTPDWKAPGNTAEVDEYIRRQHMTAHDYADFLARLKADYPDESFVVVRFGDHQPAISHKLLEPNADPAQVATRIRRGDTRYFATYFAIDTINHAGVDWSKMPQQIDAAYLPVVIQDAAGLPLEPTFAEQKRIMQRCGGVFYACNGGYEAKRFNRLLIEAGLIKGL